MSSRTTLAKRGHRDDPRVSSLPHVIMLGSRASVGSLSPQLLLEDGTTYRPLRPTRLDKIKNLHLEVRPGFVILPRLHELLGPCIIGVGLDTLSPAQLFGETSRRDLSSTIRIVSSVV